MVTNRALANVVNFTEKEKKNGEKITKFHITNTIVIKKSKEYEKKTTISASFL